MFNKLISIMILCVMSSMTACTDETVYAPVSDLSSIDRIPASGAYHVRAGDTLYSIAWRYGLDYRQVMKINHLNKPHIEPGQALYLKKSPAVNKRQPKKAPIPQFTPQEQKIEEAPTARVSKWIWPINGPIITPFTDLNKGLNIGGVTGESVLAAAPGVVVYSGDALKAYGNLIIIKHNNEFLSAYAYNARIFVNEGMWVKRGQTIAELGPMRTKTVMLHFEIRRNGKPVNPLSYLPRR